MKLEEIVDISVIDKLRKDKSFCVEGRGVIFEPEYVKALVDYVKQEGIILTKLSLSCCGITSASVEFICKLKDLKYLDLSENHLEMWDIKVLREQLPNLENVDFSYNPGNDVEIEDRTVIFSGSSSDESDTPTLGGPSELSTNDPSLTPQIGMFKTH